MKKIIFFSVFFLVSAGTCLAQDALFLKEASAPQNCTDKAGSITLDADIYRNTDDAFANLRIYDENNKEVPFVVRKSRGNEKKVKEYSVRMKNLSLQELPNNRLSIVMEIDKQGREKNSAIPCEVNINTPNANFEKTVSVFGSNDKDQWTALCENQPIFDYSRFIDIRNTTVAFKGQAFTYYKLVIDNVSQALVSSFSQIFTKYTEGKVREEYAAFIRDEGVLRINSLNFLGREEMPVYGEKRTAAYPLEIIRIETNNKDKSSDIYLSSNREPLTGLFLEVKDENFKRKVEVEGTNDAGKDATWTGIAYTEILNINAGQFHKEKLKIDLPQNESRYLKYRLRVFNNDNSAIGIISVRAEGTVDEAVFFHHNKKSLKVCYGGEGFKQPEYDIASVLAEIPPVAGESWKIGPETANKVTTKKKPLFSSRQLFAAALVIMVIVLIGLIAISVKKVDEKTK